MRCQVVFRRTVVLVLLAVVGLAFLPGGGARADTLDPGISIEGWFARSRPRNPVVEIPCPPAPLPPPPTGCGPVSPAPVPAPQAETTGAYVVASAGGDAGASDTSGDLGWTVFQWDLLEHIGATVEKFEFTLTQAPNNRGDNGVPVISACNIVVPFGAEAGANPWPDRPTLDCSSARAPLVDNDTTKYTFDVTDYAETWLEGKGFGVAIVPGAPGQTTGLEPFQITFAGYYSTAPNAASVRPRVTFQYTPSALDDLGTGGFEDFGAGFDDLGGGVTDFAADPSLDIIPTDVGSPPVTAGEDEGKDFALPPARPVSTSSGKLPLSLLLLLPLALVAFWGTGTALGPAGDPLPARKGGVSRMLEHRRADEALATHDPRD